MNLVGKLKAKMPLQSGTSQAGRAWNKMQFVIQKKGTKTPKEVAFDTLNDELIQFLSDTSIGTELNVSFDVESREFNGKYYSSITAYSAEVNRDIEVSAHSGVKQMAQMYNQEYQRAKAEPVVESDLPF